MPWARNAPKLWPADPLNVTDIVLSGKPSLPYFFATVPDSIAPTERSVLVMGKSSSTGIALSIAG
jgi:hypothetical protein